MFVLYLPINHSETEIIACSENEQKLRDIATDMIEKSRAEYKRIMNEAEQHHKQNEQRAKNWLWLNREYVKSTTSWLKCLWTPKVTKELFVKNIRQYEVSYWFYPGNETYLSQVVDIEKVWKDNVAVLELDCYGMPRDFVDYSYSTFIIKEVKRV